MKTKHITALLVFVLTFTSSAALAGFFRVESDTTVYLSDADKISALLIQDIENGRQRNFEMADADTDYAFSTLDYVENSEAINDSDLPQDFQNAWHAHMNAWHKHANYLAKIEDEDETSEDVTISRNISEINRTWWEVLRVARRHGATIPREAYY